MARAGGFLTEGLRENGRCKGYYFGHLGLPSGQPPDTPRMAVGHVREARARSI